MTIAIDFADTFIEYIRSRNTEFDDFVLSMYSRNTLSDVIVALYWAISNTYDIRHHAPVPESDWLNLMEYNYEHILTYIFNHPDDYAADDIMMSIQNLFDDGVNVDIDVPISGMFI